MNEKERAVAVIGLFCWSLGLIFAVGIGQPAFDGGAGGIYFVIAFSAMCLTLGAVSLLYAAVDVNE
jgi:hypothetical protein